MSIRNRLQIENLSSFELDDITIKEIKNERDLAYATIILELKAEQKNLVNPAGFSIGRAFLNPSDNVPCLICKRNTEPIGFISLYKWFGRGKAYSLSYFIDKNYQNLGYGTKVIKLATRILKTINPQMEIKLAVEKNNLKAQYIYTSIGFSKIDELDGNDFLYII